MLLRSKRRFKDGKAQRYFSVVENRRVRSGRVALDEAVKPLQSRGDFGPRDICMKVWAFPIPLYNGHTSAHEQLAHLGRECGDIAQYYLDSLPAKIREGSLGWLRNMIREKLRPQLDEIDELVRAILNLDSDEERRAE